MTIFCNSIKQHTVNATLTFQRLLNAQLLSNFNIEEKSNLSDIWMLISNLNITGVRCHFIYTIVVLEYTCSTLPTPTPTHPDVFAIIYMYMYIAPSLSFQRWANKVCYIQPMLAKRMHVWEPRCWTSSTRYFKLRHGCIIFSVTICYLQRSLFV